MARYSGGRTPGASLKFPREYYYPEALKAGVLTEQQMRQEYSRLRAIANKRLQRFVGSAYEDSQTYLKNAGKFVPLAAINSPRELLYKLVEVSRFVSAKGSSITGIREINQKKIDTLREHDIHFVNHGNIREFGEFMDWWRDGAYKLLYGSEKLADVYGEAVRWKGIDVEELKENFEYFMENLHNLKAVPRARSLKDRTADEYRSRIDAYLKRKQKQEEQAAKKSKKRR